MKNTVKYVSFVLAMLLNATLLIGCDRHDKPEHETDTENLAQTDISTDEKVIDPDLKDVFESFKKGKSKILF